MSPQSTSSLHRDALDLAGTDTLRSMATSAGQNATGHVTEDSTGFTPEPSTLTRGHAITDDGMHLRGLCNPQNCCYVNATVQGLLWGAIQVGALQASQWEILPEIFHQLLTPSPAEPLLLWSNGPWLTLLQIWAKTLRNCCLLWLNSRNGGAMTVDSEATPSATGSLALLTKDQMMEHLKHAFSPGEPWQDAWLSSIDSLDVGFLLEWPDVCRYLAHRVCWTAGPPLLAPCGMDCSCRAAD